MALARSWSVSLLGLDGHVVEVEADLANGIPGLSITGLPDASLGEARDRVRAAVVNSGHAFPSKRVTLGLSPSSPADPVAAGCGSRASRCRPGDIVASPQMSGELEPLLATLSGMHCRRPRCAVAVVDGGAERR